jgi:nucleotide-binding universal stress UspA family protein
MINRDMGMYDTILVPTDGSAGFEQVIAHAGEIAGVHDADVLALYVVDATSYTGLPMEASWEGVREVLDGQGEAALAEVERLLDDEVDLETTTVEGRPSREIVRVARDRGADCIVMGTHGRGGIDRLILGSVAERVVRSAPVPVVTVRLEMDDAVGTVDEEREEGWEPAAAGPG